jgi:hypothetical protein
MSGSDLQIAYFHFSMTSPTETNHIVQLVCLLGLVMISDGNDVVNIWFLTEIVAGRSTQPACVVVPFAGLPSYFGPGPSILDFDPATPHRVSVVPHRFGPPLPVTVTGTEPVITIRTIRLATVIARLLGLTAFPVRIVFSRWYRRRVTCVAVRSLRLIVVELLTTRSTGAVRKALSVNTEVVDAHPMSGIEFLPARWT